MILLIRMVFVTAQTYVYTYMHIIISGKRRSALAVGYTKGVPSSDV